VFEIHDYGHTDCLVTGVLALECFEKKFLMFNESICFFFQLEMNITAQMMEEVC
jgi:hypothetical protein